MTLRRLVEISSFYILGGNNEKGNVAIAGWNLPIR